MAQVSLTETAVAQAAAPAAGRLELWDRGLPGFGLRVTDKGRKSWQLMYRFGGRKRRMTLGGYPALSLEHARDAALEALRDLAKGRDPAAERATMTGGPLTFEAFARAYLERHAKRNKRSWPIDAGIIERDLLPAWRRRPAESLSRRDVIKLLEDVVARGHPQAANRRLALLRKMFAWGIEVDLVGATPVAGIRAPAPPVHRDRLLAAEEITRLWAAWDRMGWPFGPFFKLLLLTGQKRSDLAALRLTEIALADQVWRPPGSAGKGGAAHELPLSTFAIEILTALPRSGSAYVFPARSRPGHPISGFSAAVARARQLAELDDWRLQDLRRTAAVGMARLGVAPELLDQILNVRSSASTAGLRGIYRLAAAAEEKRRALEAWAEELRRMVEGRTAE